MKKNELNLVFLGLGYSFSAVFPLELEVTTADDTRITLNQEDSSVSLWLLCSHLSHGNTVRISLYCSI